MLFDNNDYSFLDLVNNQDNNTNMYTVKEGFLRGNMFRDEYLPYKNYSYININPKSGREAKLYNVMQYEFVINDLNLYLDIHPNDEYALNMLEELIKSKKEEEQEFEKSYGPLEVCDTVGDSFEWVSDPWPWEKEDGGSIYV